MNSEFKVKIQPIRVKDSDTKVNTRKSTEFKVDS